jgi:hypothetical protein
MRAVLVLVPLMRWLLEALEGFCALPKLHLRLVAWGEVKQGLADHICV